MGAVVGEWNGFYTSIFRANIVLDRAPQVEFTDTDWQAQLIAEAKFIRGHSYLMLTKLYGDVPLLLSVEDHDNAVGKARDLVDDVHAQVVMDLTEAEADLPGYAARAQRWLSLGRPRRARAPGALRTSRLRSSGAPPRDLHPRA